MVDPLGSWMAERMDKTMETSTVRQTVEMWATTKAVTKADLMAFQTVEL